MVEQRKMATLDRGSASVTSKTQRLRATSAKAWRTCLSVTPWLALLSSASCLQEEEQRPSEEVATHATALRHRAQESVTWSACPSDFLDQCAWLTLPVAHNEPKSERIAVFVSRRLARSGRGHSQLWLLQGGPGGSSNTFKDFIDAVLGPALPDVDFYLLEHRGVGESSRLGCPEQEAAASEAGRAVTPAELPLCVASLNTEWGQALAHFSLTEDAHDLASAIDLTRERNKRVLVYGVSYGSARALRFLQAHPHAADGVILDSVIWPGHYFVSDLDVQLDPVAQELARACADDPVCNTKLGPNPWDKLRSIMDALVRGHCPTFTHRDILRRGDLLPGREDRIHMLALLYRLDRCAPDDVVVVERYFDAWLRSRPIPGSGDRDSFALAMNVTFSELWPRPAPSTAELVARCDGQLFCPGVGVSLSGLREAWPSYPLDRYYGAAPRANSPVLMLHGELDTQTPLALARALARQLDARHQTLVKISYGTHATAFSSPVRSEGLPNCGTQLIASFVRNPRGRVDTSCLSDLRPPFDIDPQLKQRLFGDADLWENGPSP